MSEERFITKSDGRNQRTYENPNWRPVARNSDPATSHKAEAKHLGKRAVRARQVLKLVRDYPLCTSSELSVKMYETTAESFMTSAATPHKRLPDLEALGLVQRRGERKCTDSGHEAAVWEITDRGERELT